LSVNPVIHFSFLKHFNLSILCDVINI
jgi:hypothetical protein